MDGVEDILHERLNSPAAARRNVALGPSEERALSKKEQVLHLARYDPFLRIEEIARRVGTTAPYVRTVLSESRVLLGELRRAYARDMERRLTERRPETSPAAPVEKGAGLVDFCARFRPAGPVEFERVPPPAAERLAREWGIARGAGLVLASCRALSEDGVECLYRLAGEFDPGARLDEGQLESWPARLGLAPGVRIARGRTAIEVEAADARVAGSVGLAGGEPVLAVRRAVLAGGIAVGVEDFLFHPGAVRVVFGGEPGLVRVERKSPAERLPVPGEELMA